VHDAGLKDRPASPQNVYRANLAAQASSARTCARLICGSKPDPLWVYNPLRPKRTFAAKARKPDFQPCFTLATLFQNRAIMSVKSLLLLCTCVLTLSGCLQNDTQRGLAGAAGGAVIASATGGSAVTGAVVGGAAGYFCRDLNIPGCRNN
jgi:osmotically inducible lipoprotein OsmB